MPVLKSAGGATLFVKREERLHVGVLDRAPKRPARQRSQNRLCTGRFFFCGLRIAGEDLRAARGDAAAGSPVGSADDQLPHIGRAARHIEPLDARAVQPEVDGIGNLRNTGASAARTAAATSRAFAFGLQVLARRRHTHPVQPGLDRDAHLVGIDLWIVLPDRRTWDANLEDVFAVDREVVLNRDACARIERQIVADPLVAGPFHRVPFGVVNIFDRLQRRVADGKPAYSASGRHVALEQRW